MKKTYLSTRFCLWLLTIILATSCSIQEKPNAATESPAVNETLIPYAYSGDQIAEYIRNIIQDKNGHLWFGTNGFGVAHFNGENLTYFSNKQGFGGGQITGMTEDLDQNIWFATNQGIVKYDWSESKEGEKIFINVKDDAVLKPGMVRSIFADSKGTIWIGTTQGPYRYNGTELEFFELPYSNQFATDDSFFTKKTIWSIMEDKKGNLWFGTNGNGAYKYDGNSFTQYTEKDGLTDNDVDNILEDSKGNFWFGTRFGGVSHYDGKTFTNYTAKEHIGDDEVCVIYEDKAGNIWFSSEGFGVYRYNESGGKVSFTNFHKEQGLGVNAVQTIFEDREGRLWVGGGGGLFQFNGNSFFNVTPSGPWD